ncbi:hypothetical protein PVW47_15070 [Marinovum sp. SP66]|uniref:hypothetical protein n=1 Tax=Marinovum algicola TaxID=42444 RepID=UPI003BF909F8|nr:hypothetical protein [Marinovum sp. SP66]
MADLGAEAEMRLRRTGDDKEKTRQDIDCPLRREKAGTSLGKTNPHEFARLRVDKIQVTELLGKCDNNLRGRHHRHPFSPRPQSARALVRPAPGYGHSMDAIFGHSVKYRNNVRGLPNLHPQSRSACSN